MSAAGEEKGRKSSRGFLDRGRGQASPEGPEHVSSHSAGKRTTSAQPCAALLTVLVVVAPDVHELAGRQVLELPSLLVPELAHEVGTALAACLDAFGHTAFAGLFSGREITQHEVSWCR